MKVHSFNVKTTDFGVSRIWEHAAMTTRLLYVDDHSRSFPHIEHDTKLSNGSSNIPLQTHRSAYGWICSNMYVEYAIIEGLAEYHLTKEVGQVLAVC